MWDDTAGGGNRAGDTCDPREAISRHLLQKLNQASVRPHICGACCTSRDVNYGAAFIALAPRRTNCRVDRSDSAEKAPLQLSFRNSRI